MVYQHAGARAPILGLYGIIREWTASQIPGIPNFGTHSLIRDSPKFHPFSPSVKVLSMDGKTPWERI